MRGKDLKVPGVNEWGSKRVDFYVNPASRTREDGDLNQEDQELLQLEEEDAVERQHKLDSINSVLDYKKLGAFVADASDSDSDEDEEKLLIEGSSASNSKFNFGPVAALPRITLSKYKKSNETDASQTQKTVTGDQTSKQKKNVRFDLGKRAAPSQNQRKRKSNVVEGWDDEKEAFDDRRQITDKIQKNKGLLQKRKKDISHSRVKRRHQYKKALIKRRSQIPDVKRETTKYTGESRGIRMSTVRSVPLKG